MKIAYNWLKQYIDLPEDIEEIGAVLTQTGLEVEGIEEYHQVEGGLTGLVVGEVLTCAKHPNADKLSITTVDVGQGRPYPIVCGAPNVAAGQKVIVALPKTTLYPTSGDSFQIKKSKVRGEVSEGMICAEDEIGLGTAHDGIMVLDTDLPNGTPAAKALGMETEYVFEIGLTPNRVDGASHIGTARDLKAAFDRAMCTPSIEDFKVDSPTNPVEVVVENTEACPRYAGVTLSGVKVAESPGWLQHRLKSIGLSPINNIVDITNFVLHETGQPLHAFDLAEVTGNKVIVKTLPAGTPFITLDETERKLSDKDLMICDGEGKGMCIAGVFGGIKSGVKESTTDIFLESAYFAPAYVRRTSQKHTLKTDAAFRFERGVDPNATIYALKRAALLIKEIAGGTISSEIVDIYPEPIGNFEVKVKYAHIDRLIGKKLDKAQIKTILNNLDIELTQETEEGFVAIVPPYRIDVQREADVIEEILRIYGYNNIEISEFLGAESLANFPAIESNKLQQNITQTLAANGFSEIINNSLTKPAYAAAVDQLNAENDVVILNKLSEELEVMRQTLLFSGLEVINHNINRKQKDLKLFEFGKIYHKTDGQYQEARQMSVFVTGNEQAESWMAVSKQSQFHSLATAIAWVCQKFGLTNVENENIESNIFSFGVNYTYKNKVIAQAGMVSDKILQMNSIEQDVFYAEIYWEQLLKFYQDKVSFEEIPKFPEVQRDLSLVLDEGVSFQEIKKIAEKTERNLLKSVNVFDVYVGKSIPEGKKAYALRFILQDNKKTLNDKAIDKTMKKLRGAFEHQLAAVIRE
ncbi:phenylalanine--tRNA ligase subunit beta [Microscilla marina]|uniref:Phenylalanine--tRNA ligase beta subunit n=1 Tax=Microscilla marina ATCC 23134 TaxID=313606 RepID=A2A079_MICM2|nr:phenylalanine--tRNA ligase subunit beta [Microscilla marina]EAY23968.1 phenylalanyl-tRNA synthetase, beta subunit [Microscilla marina ATCC 23134]